MDQAARLDQAVLWDLRKSREDTDMDRRLGLRAGRHRPGAAEAGRVALQRNSNSVVSPGVRANRGITVVESASEQRRWIGRSNTPETQLAFGASRTAVVGAHPSPVTVWLHRVDGIEQIVDGAQDGNRRKPVRSDRIKRPRRSGVSRSAVHSRSLSSRMAARKLRNLAQPFRLWLRLSGLRCARLPGTSSGPAFWHARSQAALSASGHSSTWGNRVIGAKYLLFGPRFRCPPKRSGPSGDCLSTCCAFSMLFSLPAPEPRNLTIQKLCVFSMR
jgi:hypothetical protein